MDRILLMYFLILKRLLEDEKIYKKIEMYKTFIIRMACYNKSVFVVEMFVSKIAETLISRYCFKDKCSTENRNKILRQLLEKGANSNLISNEQFCLI